MLLATSSLPGSYIKKGLQIGREILLKCPISKYAPFGQLAQCLKLTENVPSEFLNFGIYQHFCPIKSDLSGNTI